MRLNLGILRYGWLVVGPLFVACDDATGPGRQVTGSYVLQHANGDPLPFTIDMEFSRPEALLAEELVFLPLGDVVRVRTIRRSLESGDSTVAVVIHDEYRVRGSEIEVGHFPECPPDVATADCMPNDRGTLTADGLELNAVSLQFVEPPLLTYERRQ